MTNKKSELTSKDRIGFVNHAGYFIATTILGLLSVQGKGVADYFFGLKETPLYANSSTLIVFIVVFGIPALFLLVRLSSIPTTRRLVVLIVMGLLGALAVQTNSGSFSVLIFCLCIFVWGCSGLIVVFEPFLGLQKGFEFWKFVLQAWIKFFGLVFVMYGIGMTVLKFFSEKTAENPMDFASTFTYPLVILLLTLAHVTYWIILPLWEKVVETAPKK